jgi:DNA-binding IscR family transcriptional regulator
VAGGSVAQLREVVDGLAEAGLLVATREQPPTYLLARAAGTIRLGEILAAVGVGGAAGEAAPEVRGLLVEVAVAVDSAVADRTLADLLAAAGATAA